MAFCLSTAPKLTTKRVLNTKRIVNVRAVNKERSVEAPKYLEFAETINGRCAMQGFIWGSVREALTGQTIFEQLVTKTSDGHINIMPAGVLDFTVIVALVSLGTAITSFNQKNDEGSSNFEPAFTEDAEIINGRLAMVGFALLLGVSISAV